MKHVSLNMFVFALFTKYSNMVSNLFSFDNLASEQVYLKVKTAIHFYSSQCFHLLHEHAKCQLDFLN